jgi:2-polyprenyl-6-methoxyphenol hydroxylase-like FAD-dependent oxidoreductase
LSSCGLGTVSPDYDLGGYSLGGRIVVRMLVRGATPGRAVVGGQGLRELLGIGFPGRSFDDQFLICDIRAELSFPSERRFFFDPSWNPGRQVLVHQCPGGVWRIDWQVAAGFDLDAERASGALDERIRQITGDQPYEIVWATAYRFHERIATRSPSGAFRLYDAAHLYAPFGARGLNSGAQDAENLAWKIARPARLGTWRRFWHLRLRARAAAREFAGHQRHDGVPVPQTGWPRRHREVLERALVDPSARSLINSGKLASPTGTRQARSPRLVRRSSSSRSGRCQRLRCQE